MKKVKNMMSFVGLIAVIGLGFQAVQSSDSSVEKESNKTTQEAPKTKKDPNSAVKDYNVYSIPLPEKMDFAGEEVPLENPDIRERLDRELLVNTYWQSNGLLLIKRAHKYFPMIEPILKENGIPEDFKYLAIAESGLQHIVSPAGATGFWQIMKSTARENGLEVNSNVDERYHIEKSTMAACRYLLEAKEKFGSWTLAAAAYNAGKRGISRQQERQEVKEYYDLLLNPETGRYVFRILALKEILSQPDKYGFNFKEKDLYNLVETREIEVDTAVSDFAKFSKKFGINYKLLKLHNPWLREKNLNNASRKAYQIKIPVADSYTYKP